MLIVTHAYQLNSGFAVLKAEIHGQSIDNTQDRKMREK